MPFYAVANGRTIGIFLNWNECNRSVKGYKNALFKKFDTREEANQYIITHSHDVVLDTAQINDIIPDYCIYTDGACSNNGKNNAVAGIGIFFGINDERNISKRIGGKQTNNTAELSAIIETYPIIECDISIGKKIAIISDSEYAIKCVSSYGEKCYNKNWNVDIPNKELVKTAYEMYKDTRNIQFIHIKAHTNNNDMHSIGNKNADKLANLAIGSNKSPNEKPKKVYLDVNFIKKDEIKNLGGIWDKTEKKWFIYDNNENIDMILSIL